MVDAKWMTTTSVSLTTACVVGVPILQGSMPMDRSVKAMENVNLFTVKDPGLGVLVPVHEGKQKAKAAIDGLAMTQR